jgi:hypothetical protein
MADWKLLPVGGMMVMVSAASISRDDMAKIMETAHQLKTITGVPWVFIPNTELVSDETVQKISERFYGMKR